MYFIPRQYSYSDEGLKDIAVDSETVCFWLIVHNFVRATKTLCCL